MSKVFDLDIDGNAEKALARDIAWDPISDEPIHIDFIRITKGSILTFATQNVCLEQYFSPKLKNTKTRNTLLLNEK